MPTYYVSIQTGDDANDGLTPETAWATITKAAQTLQPGDTVYVAPGTYYETVVPARSGSQESDGTINFITYVADRYATHFPFLPPGEVIISGLDPATGIRARSFGININFSGLGEYGYLIFDGFATVDTSGDGIRISRSFSGEVVNPNVQLRHVYLYRCTSDDALSLQYTTGGQSNSQSNTRIILSDIFVDSCRATRLEINISMEPNRPSVRQNYNLYGLVSNLLVRNCVLDAINYSITLNHVSDFHWNPDAYYYSDPHLTYSGIQVDGCRLRTLQFGISRSSRSSSTGSPVLVTKCVVENSPVGLEFTGPGVTYFADRCVFLNVLDPITGSGYRRNVISYRPIGSLSGIVVVRDPDTIQLPAGVSRDSTFSLVGRASLRIAATSGRQEYTLPPVLGKPNQPLTLDFLARKNFKGGTVTFHFGNQEVSLLDHTHIQAVRLVYTPTVAGLVPFAVEIDPPDGLSEDPAVWIDNVAVS